MYFVGVMSGTSCDGIDVALVDFSSGIRTIATSFQKYPPEVKEQLQQIISQQAFTISEFSELDAKLGHLYAQAVNDLLLRQKLKNENIQAIGLHGQTVYHDPDGQLANTWQMGSAAIVAQQTGITTVANFRQMDVAYGGQGAPLAPAFHQQIFANLDEPIAVLNLGGIANITVIDGDQVFGFDTGPANCLMDEWSKKYRGCDYDENGVWARKGSVNTELLDVLLQEPYFSQLHPKSTGRELFNMTWLLQNQQVMDLPAVDVQRTLLQLTVESIAISIRQVAPKISKMVICGGGSHNQFLLGQLSTRLSVDVQSSAEYGIDPDFMEAILMAWLAQQNLLRKKIDFTSITGCSKELVYGVKYVI